MSDHRDSVIARWLRAGDQGDLDAFDALLHEDVMVHAPGGLSTSGRAQEKDVWRAALAAMPDLHHEVQEVVAEEGVEMARVIVTGTMVGTFGGVDGTGRSFRMDQAVVVHLRDGMVKEAWEIADLTALKDQVGDA